MKKNILLKNVKASKTLVKEIEDIDDKIDFYHSEPIQSPMSGLLSTFFNVSLLSAFVTLSTISWTVFLAAPVVFLFIRGTIMTNKLNKIMLKRKMQKHESDINMMLRDKNEKMIELTNLSILEEKYLSVDTLDKFEMYLETNQASTLEKCVELYKDEKTA